MNRIRYERQFAQQAFSVGLISTLLVLLHAGPSHSDEPTLVIKNARVIVGNGHLKDNATIVIKGDRILSLLEQVPDVHGRKTIDAHGKTVMPGLIDSHIHLLSWVASDGEEAAKQYLKDEVPATLEQYLSNGVTTIKSIADPVDLVVELRNRVQLDQLASPRLLIVGPCFTATGGHPAVSICKGDPWCRRQLCIEVDDSDVARTEVRKLAVKKVDAIKIVYDGETPGWTKLRLPVLKAIIDEAHVHGLRVTVHTPTESDGMDAVNAGADGLEHGVGLGRLTGDQLSKLMIERGASYVPTLSVGLYLNGRGKLTTPMLSLRKLHEQGVTVVAGTDTFGEQEAGATTIQELELMVEAGLPAHDVVQAATGNAAKHLGLLSDIGTVEVGKIADLIIVEGDPLTNISALRNVKIVVQARRIVHSVD